ncbi:helix-turn-helix domain-containing protein [Galbibacter mesophilus]|uniref:helix-turn-helix domain-containing protein n=1 Tax=Galbibacter mesophilus TaxID=379069 RepID=UPI00191E73F5|nr:helix-turn-helix transcriptional regulator [Galbibacter mesophilus]MCM5661365.1 helix-turn-helix domain-containing protein [Galbibacter mesophilus]
MTLFGKNIKKIRTVKGLSQQSFAELFSLKRGTLGAYEEGRSEPKLETVIKIANHFSISIDDMLTKELTVNQLSSFQMDSEYFKTKKEPINMIEIPCIIESLIDGYIQYHANENFIADLPQIKLPIQSDHELRAFLVHDLEMSNNNDGLFPEDIVIGKKLNKEEWSNIDDSNIYLITTTNDVTVRRISHNGTHYTFKADHPKISDSEFEVSKINEIWKIEFVIYHRIPELKKEHLKTKLDQLEAEFKKLKSSL